MFWWPQFHDLIAKKSTFVWQPQFYDLIQLLIAHVLTWIMTNNWSHLIMTKNWGHEHMNLQSTSVFHQMTPPTFSRAYIYYNKALDY